MFRSSRYWLLVIIVSLTALPASVKEARAEFTIDLEVREAYEDNVIGLVADNPNIISSTVGAAAGGGGGGAAGGDLGGKGGGKGGGGGAKALHMRAHGGELNDVPLPVTSTPSTTAATPTPAGTASGGVVTAGDFSTNIGVDAGYSHDLGDITTLLFIAGVEHTAYSTYTQFDFTIASLSAGVAVSLTDDLTGKVTLRDAVKRFNNGNRNANAYGASVSLRERLTPAFWVKGVYSIEQNNADLFTDSYLGNSYGVWAGYALTAKITAGLGFSYLTRDFKSTQFRLTSKTASADLTWEFYDKWSVNAGFDQERADSNIPGSASTDNIYSVGLMYSY